MMTETADSLVHVVDDDPDVRDSLRWTIENAGHRVAVHPSATAFLGAYDPDVPGCVVLDIRMPEMSGLELQQVLIERRIHASIVVISGHADVPMAVRAVQRGAIDVLEKPFDNNALLERIRDALEYDKRKRTVLAEKSSLEERLGRLTKREREVMAAVVQGKTTRMIAGDLEISPRTIEKHRERLMRKMEADSTAELVVMGIQAGMVD